MTSEANVRGAFRIQEHYCRVMDAPIYAGVCAAIAERLTRETQVGTRILDWPGEPTRDALPLRFVGGLHALVLAGKDAELADVFAGRGADPAALNRVIARHDAALLPWLDGPPQTNEPGRSAALMLGLLEVARRHGPKVEILEIGSSAGLNLLIDRYRFDLGGTIVGPADAVVSIRPDWRGPPPEPAQVDIVSVRGCDVAPMDATDPAIEARLAEPQEPGVTRVLMHSVVWQYLPEPVADRIRQAMAGAAARATDERPLGWVIMEPDRALAQQVVRVRSWPGDGAWADVAMSHAHGTWIDTSPVVGGDAGIDLPEGARIVV